MNSFTQLFGRLQGAIIGMVHLRPLPGTPRCVQSLKDVINQACEEADIYKQNGVDGILVENMHDLPWLIGDKVGPEITASMSVVCSKVRDVCPNLPIGVQILAGANKQALAVAKAAGLNFVRAEGFVFSHVGDEGTMDSCAADLMRFRRHIGAEHVQIYTDIKKKHSAHTITMDVSVKDTALAAEFFDSNGVIITGPATGRETNVHELQEVLQTVAIPVLVGSGITEENVSRFMQANALIVGSEFKMDGTWKTDLDPTKVCSFMDRVKYLREVGDRVEQIVRKSEHLNPILSQGE